MRSSPSADAIAPFAWTQLAATLRQSGRLLPAVLTVAALALVVLAQSHYAGAFSAELSSTHSDEASHYVTALLVRDYLLSGFGQGPIAFAQDFYLHYPKVAMGQWPPAFYALAGTWMMLFGTSLAAALALTALLSGALAGLTLAAARASLDAHGATILAVLFLGLPLVRMNTQMFMTDVPIALLTLAASLAYAQYLATRRCQWSLLFGVIAAIALLTKGSGGCLALLPPLALLLGGRFALLRLPSFWLPLPIVALGAIPWYAATLQMTQGSFLYEWGLSYVATAVPANAAILAGELGPLLALSVLGVAASARAAWRRQPGAETGVALSALLLAVLLFQSLVPAAIEARYLMQAAAPALLLAAMGASALMRFVLARWRPLGKAAPILAIALLVILAAPLLLRPTVKPELGFSAAVRDALAAGETGPIILVGASAPGEGSVVSSVALADPARRWYVARGMKLLAASSWTGAHYQTRHPTADAVAAHLDRIGVGMLILDTAPESLKWQHNRQLLQAMQTHAQDWRLVATHETVKLYRRTGPAAPDLELLRRETVSGKQLS